MAKLVLIHKTDSIYEDRLDTFYDFPRSYLKVMQSGIGDWIIYYEPVKAGARGYFAVARIQDIIPKPGTPGRYLALIEPGSFLPFDRDVPRLIDGSPLEAALREPDGSAKKGGAVQLAVRRLSDKDFTAIVDRGLPQDLEQIESARYAHVPAAAEGADPFARPVIERLTSRPYRDVAFRRKVREAYDYRCAMSGLRLRNGGGRPEVQAAHIRPVEHKGSDSVRNGLALSGTLHWMFDRGLISVAEDCETILVSRNKVPSEVIDRLLPANGRLLRPADPRNAPHPENLKWHRETIFGQADPGETAPWH